MDPSASPSLSTDLTSSRPTKRPRSTAPLYLEYHPSALPQPLSVSLLQLPCFCLLVPLLPGNLSTYFLNLRLKPSSSPCIFKKILRKYPCGTIQPLLRPSLSTSYKYSFLLLLLGEIYSFCIFLTSFYLLSYYQGSLLALELAHRAKQHESSQQQISQVNQLLSESQSTATALAKQVSAKEMELEQVKKRNIYLEKEVQTLSLAKLEERRKGIL